MKAEGGCLCRNIRYSIDAELIDAGYCHCSICQKSSGAPAVAWFTIPYSGFSYVAGNIGVYTSSMQYQREFCPNCGTQIAFRAQSNPEKVDVTICSLDEPSLVEPQYHIWYQDKVAWLHMGDDLPKFSDSGPDWQ